MAIAKQEFYEGAALHRIARTGQITSIRYASPFFMFNDWLAVLLKYSTRNRSPWGFTFTADEQNLLKEISPKFEIIIGLICGADGIAAFNYESYLRVTSPKKTAIHISCYRQHREHYEVAGPEGRLDRKVSPSNWQRIFELRK